MTRLRISYPGEAPEDARVVHAGRETLDTIAIMAAVIKAADVEIEDTEAVERAVHLYGKTSFGLETETEICK